MNTNDDSKARIEIAEDVYKFESYNGLPSYRYVYEQLECLRFITHYNLSKDFFREWRNWFERFTTIHLKYEYEGEKYEHIKHNLKELNNANINFKIITDIEAE